MIPGAARLLEGCGSITPGDCGDWKTAPLPFITVFVGDNLPAEKQEKLLQTLLNIKADAKVTQVLGRAGTASNHYPR